MSGQILRGLSALEHRPETRPSAEGACVRHRVMNLDWRVLPATVCITAAVLIFLTGCASTAAGGRDSIEVGMTADEVRKRNSIEVGMTAAEVRKLMGRPDYRRAKLTNDAWLYMNRPDYPGIHRCEYLTFWFRDGILQGTTTLLGRYGHSCAFVSRVSTPYTFDWDQMPNPSVDVNVDATTDEAPTE